MADDGRRLGDQQPAAGPGVGGSPEVIFDEEPEIVDEPDAVDLQPMQGRIEFRDLTFTYPGADRPAL